jgi:hypothetical protein
MSSTRVRTWCDLGVLVVAVILATALFAATEWWLVGGWGFPLDDAWIHLQLARNFTWQHGFAFNPGEPAAGSTAPGWTLLLALLRFLPLGPVLVAKLSGVLLLLLTAWATRGLAQSYGLGGAAAMGAALIVVLTPRLLWASLSGMEVLLGAALATAGLWAHARCWQRGPSLLASALFAAAALARPECLVFFPLAILDRWPGRGEYRAELRRQVPHILLYCAILAPFVWLNLQAIGRPLPNTFYAKVGGYGLLGALADGAAGRVARCLFYYPVTQTQELIQFVAENSVLLAVAAPFGLLGLLRQRRSKTAIALLPVLAVVGYPLFRGLLAPFKGPTFQHGRYAAHLIPVLTVIGVLGLRQVGLLWVSAGDAPATRWRRAAGWIAWALVMANLMVMDVAYARTLGRDVGDIQRTHVAMGRWLAENTPRDCVIAASDIGAVGYFSGRRVLDVVGLVTPEVLPYLEPGVPADDGVLAFLRSKRPDYLVVLPNWYPALVQRTRLLKAVHRIRVPGRTIVGGPEFVAYRLDWDADGTSARDRRQ